MCDFQRLDLVENLVLGHGWHFLLVLSRPTLLLMISQIGLHTTKLRPSLPCNQGKDEVVVNTEVYEFIQKNKYHDPKLHNHPLFIFNG